MQIKSLQIGRLTTKNNLLLAPLAGFSDLTLRQICLECGAGLTFTEMVSAKGLKYNNEATKALLETSEAETIKAVQLFGSDPQIMREACESEWLQKFDIVDINMGCPVPKVFNNGEGSNLLSNISLAEKIVAECVKSGKIVTVKMRTGIHKGENTALTLAKAVENAGASMVTIHGRAREEYYFGDINYGLIAEIKNSLKIPVIANGGIFTCADADKMMSETGADGVMLARGALNDPRLFSWLCGKQGIDKKQLILHHIDLCLKHFSPHAVGVGMRKQFACYLSGIRGAKQAKAAIFATENVEEIKRIISQLDFSSQGI